MPSPIELRAPQPQAERTWQPTWVEGKGAWVCSRLAPQGQVGVEQWGAYLSGPGDVTPVFAVGYFPAEHNAAAICATLNGEANNGS